MDVRILPLPEDNTNPVAKIKVIGIGGAGGNAVNRMISANLGGVEFCVLNTDCQDLHKSLAPMKVQIGAEITKGEGSGGDPEVGRRSIDESEEEVRNVLEGADMVFVAAGMGGGTGTGAAPVVARYARDLGALTVAVVTKPFLFEGPNRKRNSEQGISELRKYVNTLIAIPNERLLNVVPEDTPLDRAFFEADKILLNATRGIVDLVSKVGMINRDFRDVCSVMSRGGDALMGIGEASGEDRGKQAAEQAISSHLLEDTSIEGARAVLVHVEGDDTLTLHEVNTCCSIIQEAAGGDADMYMGVGKDKTLNGTIRVTVIATGFGSPEHVRIPAEEERLVAMFPGHRRGDDFDFGITSSDSHSTDPAADVSSYERSVPSFSRKQSVDHEVPSFLRRQAD